VLKLGVMDKVKILLTPDASDLFSPNGIKLAEKIALDQAQYYKGHRLFAIGQAISAGLNSTNIALRVYWYAVDNGINPEQVKKLVKEWLF
jgi:hypothetical protein